MKQAGIIALGGDKSKPYTGEKRIVKKQVPEARGIVAGKEYPDSERAQELKGVATALVILPAVLFEDAFFLG